MSPLVAPMAQYRQLPGKSRIALQPRVINVHTMAGTLAGSYQWASGAGRAYWHFGIAGNGAIWQAQDLRYRAAADLEGNPYYISIETEDRGPLFRGDSDTAPPWTQAQVNSLVNLIDWLCRRFGIPRSIIPDTHVSRRGIGYHRLGIRHVSGRSDAPGGPWLKPGGLRTSNAVSKICPRTVRINQLRATVMPRVQRLPVRATPPPPPPPPPPSAIPILGG